jgi:hypothetical protein
MKKREMTFRARDAEGWRRRVRLLVLPAVLGLAGPMVAGCDKLMQQPRCPELSSCGGTFPMGSWVMTPGHYSCSEDVYIPPTDTRLTAGIVPVARTPAPEPALYDWCDGLVASAAAPTMWIPPLFYFDDPVVGGASIRYSADGTYSAGLTKTGGYTLDFPAVCMREFGATDGQAIDPTATPPEPGLPLCKQLEFVVNRAGIGEGSFRNSTCNPSQSDPNGCVCAFDVTETGGNAGTWRQLDDHTILNLTSAGFPQKITYCNTGSELQLTGADGEYMFGSVGLRTLDLVPQPTTP